MSDLIHPLVNLPTPFNMIVLVVLIASAASVISCIAKQVRRYGCLRQELDLKRELVERGLSAEEIERIVAAKSSASGKDE